MVINTCCGGCNSCNCPTMNQPATNDKCLATLEMGQIGQLTWVYGLNDKLCFRYQRLVDLFPFKDCDGNAIPSDSTLVTCALFGTKLCQTFNELVVANPPEAVVEQTRLVGLTDEGLCQLFTIPAQGGPNTETPNQVTDSNTIDFSCSGSFCRIITGQVKISSDVNNGISIHADGLFASIPATPLSACAQISTFPDNGDFIPGTQLIGKDCKTYTVPASTSVSVSDTPSLNLTLTGTNISGVVVFDPATDLGSVGPFGIRISCTEVLACAPAVTITDTVTVNLTLIGQDIQADVKLATDPGNDLSVGTDGLYFNTCSHLQSFPLSGPVTYGVTELIGIMGGNCFKFTIPVPPTITILDTNTVNLTLTLGNVLSADVKIIPNTLLKEVSGGLSVTCEDVQDCVFTTTNNFWSYNDAGNSVIFFPSSDVGQQITTGSDGRPYVPPMTLTVVGTNCISLTLIGNQLSAQPIISALVDNRLSCEPDGLYVSPSDISITGVLTNCFSTQVQEPLVNQFEISTFVVISPALGNTLVCTPDGLYAGDGLSTPYVDCGDIDIPSGASLITRDNLTTAPGLVDVTPEIVIRDPVGCLAILSPSPCDGADLVSVLGSDGTNVTFGISPKRPLKVLTFAGGAIDISLQVTSDVYKITGDVSLTVPTESSCSRNDLWIKNVDSVSHTITAQIDGQPFITLSGTVPAGYPFGNNGGESVHLVYDFIASEWSVL